MTTTAPRKQRVVNVVDNRPLAREIGKRLRQMRAAAGMTQRQLAQPRYTAAYVSALENGLAKPSMAALHYLAGRLGVEIAAFLPSPSGQLSRLDADLRLASGDHQAAVHAYEALLGAAASDRERADVL
ncbi:MAG: helix-turn-helix domain-containing protein, partial [Candidatus Limnocylindria bacterium]